MMFISFSSQCSKMWEPLVNFFIHWNPIHGSEDWCGAKRENVVQCVENSSNKKCTTKIQHPLLITLIIQEIFKHLDNATLIACREVCVTWNTEACRILKKSTKHRKIYDKSLAQFLKMFNERSSDFPIRNYSFKISNCGVMHQQLFLKLGLSNMISSLILSMTANEFSTVLEYIKPLTCLIRLCLILNSETVIFGCPLISLHSKNSILLNKRSFPSLGSITFRIGEPEKRLYCNYDSLIITLVNSAQNLRNLQFISWGISMTRLFRECNLKYITSMRITGKIISESEMLILKNKRLDNLKYFEFNIDSNMNDNIFTEFVHNLKLVSYNPT